MNEFLLCSPLFWFYLLTKCTRPIDKRPCFSFIVGFDSAYWKRRCVHLFSDQFVSWPTGGLCPCDSPKYARSGNGRREAERGRERNALSQNKIRIKIICRILCSLFPPIVWLLASAAHHVRPTTLKPILLLLAAIRLSRGNEKIWNKSNFGSIENANRPAAQCGTEKEQHWKKRKWKKRTERRFELNK